MPVTRLHACVENIQVFCRFFLDQVVCFCDIGLYELFLYFGYQLLICHIICKYFLPFSRPACLLRKSHESSLCPALGPSKSFQTSKSILIHVVNKYSVLGNMTNTGADREKEKARERISLIQEYSEKFSKYTHKKRNWCLEKRKLYTHYRVIKEFGALEC